MEILAIPMYFASRRNKYFSDVQATAKYPMPSIRMNTRKSQLIGVSCMNFANQSDGSKSRYDEKSRATTMVTTNGTKIKLVWSQKAGE